MEESRIINTERYIKRIEEADMESEDFNMRAVLERISRPAQEVEYQERGEASATIGELRVEFSYSSLDEQAQKEVLDDLRKANLNPSNWRAVSNMEIIT